MSGDAFSVELVISSITDGRHGFFWAATARRHGRVASYEPRLDHIEQRGIGARSRLSCGRRSRALPLERGHREGPDFLDHSRVTWVTPIRRDKLYLSVDKIDV